MGKQQRTCIFCGASGALTREHVLPEWLQINVVGSLEGGFVGVRTSFAGEPLDERTFSSGNYTLKRVCSDCNHGWMSQLESRFALVLPKLETGCRPSKLSRAERHTAAMWTIKTGVVAHLSANYRRILPEDFPMQLQRGRVIPGGVKAFQGRIKPSDRIVWAQSNLLINTLRSTDVDEFDAQKGTFAFFITIRGLVLGFAWHCLSNHHYKLDANGSGLSQIYPKPTSWPQRHVFEHVRLAALSVKLIPR